MYWGWTLRRNLGPFRHREFPQIRCLGQYSHEILGAEQVTHIQISAPRVDNRKSCSFNPFLSLMPTRYFCTQKRPFSTFYDVTVEKYAAKPIQTLTLRQMLDFGEASQGSVDSVISSARFVHRELPVRLARRLLDLQSLPYIVVTNPSIKQVYDAYGKAFHLLQEFPEVTNIDQNNRFTRLLIKLLDEQSSLLTVLARGVRECSSRPLVGRHLDLDPFLDNMLRSRISRRVLAEQHICLQRQRVGFIGAICTQLSVAAIAEKAIAQVEVICRQTYGFAPRFLVGGDVDTKFAYIPAHLEYMLFEILKNSSRAVVERAIRAARQPGSRRLPLGQASEALLPVEVCICCGRNDVIVKVSDKGGGIDDEQMPKVWKYGYSTADGMEEMDAGRGEGNDNLVGTSAGGASGYGAVEAVAGGVRGSPMAGLGFGLPLSRLHAQYFGGDCQIISMPGYGTDVYLRIHRLGNNEETIEI